MSEYVTEFVCTQFFFLTLTYFVSFFLREHVKKEMQEYKEITGIAKAGAKKKPMLRSQQTIVMPTGMDLNNKIFTKGVGETKFRV